MNWERVKELFSAALERDAADRAAFLDEACAADTELRAEIDSLLAAHDTTGDFIEKPAVRHALDLTPQEETPNWIGRRVGDYRIVEEVGRGGMSEVYKGVRDDDEYRKDVAIKVLRRGYDTRSLLKRFKAEIQILATLDHPNIARLLDAGSTDEGLPYLVMDYIPGRTIDDYCSVHKLDLRQRLELFRELCGAVQYVHQHLMVHGDLKCSNILVSENGTVKLLDFGIARLLNPTPGLNIPDHKVTGFLALTPEFASPEQVRGGPITTASDVYSLGVVLYRLISGVLPYRLRGDFSYELAKQILEKEAAAPSVAAKEHENAETAGFARQLRGDLDNIVLMALEKDPAKRYPSVERFVEDIRRHLEGFPVTARSAGYLYQLGKFAGRHKAGITVVALLIATLMGGIVATSWQARIAYAQRERAERHFREVRKLANVFMFDFHTAIADLPGSTPARELLVKNSLEYLETLSAETGNEPTLQRELAAAYEKMADVQGGFRSANLGDATGAISSYRKALDIRKTLSAANPQDKDLKRDLLRNHGKLSESLMGEGEMKSALDNSRALLKIAQELAAAPDATVADRRNLATALGSLGFQLTRANQVGDGVIFLRQAVALYESLLEMDHNDAETRRILGVTYGRVGESLLQYTEDAAGALEMHSRALQIGQQLARADPRSPRLRKLMAYSELGMGTALSRLNRRPAGLEHQLAAVAILRELMENDQKNEIARYDAGFAIEQASLTQIELEDFAAAEQLLNDGIEILSKSSAMTASGMTDSRVVLGVSYYRLAQTYARRAARTSPTRERDALCHQARQWFELSRPVLAETERNGQWSLLTAGVTPTSAGAPAPCAQTTVAVN
jgi:non-specific serine/threonine protein kinase/serine/threonine-protein kinase